MIPLIALPLLAPIAIAAAKAAAIAAVKTAAVAGAAYVTYKAGEAAAPHIQDAVNNMTTPAAKETSNIAQSTADVNTEIEEAVTSHLEKSESYRNRCKECCKDKPCIPPVGTPKVRLDEIAPQAQGMEFHGIKGDHLHVYVRSQSPAPACECGWAEVKGSPFPAPTNFKSPAKWVFEKYLQGTTK